MVFILWSRLGLVFFCLPSRQWDLNVALLYRHLWHSFHHSLLYKYYRQLQDVFTKTVALLKICEINIIVVLMLGYVSHHTMLVIF